MAAGRGRGFTLIELLVAVAIVSILAAVAYPSYTAYARRGKIAGVTGELAVMRVNLEQWYQNNRRYSDGGANCGVAVPTLASFTFTCALGATNQEFLVTATGNGDMTGYAFTVDHENRQVTTAYPGATVPASCWLKRPSDTC
jgi:type IV pilus assembly protein PilE